MRRHKTHIRSAIFTLALLVMSGITVFGAAACGGGGQDEPTGADVTVSDVTIVQRSSSYYDFYVATDAENPQFYITASEDEDISGAESVVYAKEDDCYTFTMSSSDLGIAGTDRTRWLKVTDANGSAAIQFSVPSLELGIWLDDEGVATIEVSVSNYNSWRNLYKSSGGIVYSSSSALFDDTAVCVAENLVIGSTRYDDSRFTFARPYYFAGLQAEDGIVNFVSLPVRDTTLLISYTYASLTEEDGIAYLNVEAKAAEETDYTFNLVVRDANGRSHTVPNTGDSKQQSYRFDLTNLTSEGTWYDLLIAISETGAMYDLDSSMSSGDSVVIDRTTYSLQDYEGDLKVTYLIDRFVSTEASMAMVNGKPSLIVAVQMLDDYQPTESNIWLEIRYVATSGSKLTLPIVYGEMEGNSIVFTFDMTQMVLGAVWHDIVVVYNGVDNELPSSACTNLSSTLTYEGRTYSFKTYSGLLKITY